jgi:hypothetical protein
MVRTWACTPFAQEQRDFAAAEHWYLKSLRINEELGDEGHAAGTCRQVAIAAQLQNRFTEAGNWFLKALAKFQGGDPR